MALSSSGAWKEPQWNISWPGNTCLQRRAAAGWHCFRVFATSELQKCHGDSFFFFFRICTSAGLICLDEDETEYLWQASVILFKSCRRFCKDYGLYALHTIHKKQPFTVIALCRNLRNTPLCLWKTSIETQLTGFKFLQPLGVKTRREAAPSRRLSSKLWQLIVVLHTLHSSDQKPWCHWSERKMWMNKTFRVSVGK